MKTVRGELFWWRRRCVVPESIVCTAHPGTQWQSGVATSTGTCKRVRSSRGTRWVRCDGSGNRRQRVDGLTTFTFRELTGAGQTAQDHHHHYYYQHIRMHALLSVQPPVSASCLLDWRAKDDRTDRQASAPLPRACAPTPQPPDNPHYEIPPVESVSRKLVHYPLRYKLILQRGNRNGY